EPGTAGRGRVGRASGDAWSGRLTEDGAVAKVSLLPQRDADAYGLAVAQDHGLEIGRGLQLGIKGHEAGQAVHDRAVDLGQDVASLQARIREEAAFWNAGEGETLHA